MLDSDLVDGRRVMNVLARPMELRDVQQYAQHIIEAFDVFLDKLRQSSHVMRIAECFG